MPTSQTIWNAILTVVGAALLAAIGFLYTEVTTLKTKSASVTATRFTEEEASELRSDITLLLTEIDKRMAVMENNSDWMREWVVSSHSITNHHKEPNVPELPSLPSPPSKSFDKSLPKKIRYDLRQQEQKKK